MRRKKLLWLIPLVILLVIGGTILALPNIVSSRAHRATLEALASSLTGRQVHITGGLSLALLPQPQFIAQGITIGGPNAETITAKSLTLDISFGALLHGRLNANSLTLQSPDIDFPWPLPGGAAAVAPAPWLTALHAQITNGQISIGALHFSHVAADIFTGADGALSISGTGAVLSQPLSVSLGLGAVSAIGAAPLSIDVQSAGADAHLSGTFSAASAFTGALTLTTGPINGPDTALSQPINGTGQINADAGQIALTHLQFSQGNTALSGDATLNFATKTLSLDFAGNNLALPGGLPTANLTALGSLAINLALDESNPSIAGITIPDLQLQAAITQTAMTITALNASLPGDGTMAASGSIDAQRNLSGEVTLTAGDLPAMFPGAALPASWRQGSLNAAFAGGPNRLTFSPLSGSLGTSSFAGNAVLDRAATPAFLSGALHFDQIDLTPLDAALSRIVSSSAIRGDLEITADHAKLGQIPMSHLLADAGLDGVQLVVRRLTATVYNGRLAASFTMARSGQIAAARALVAIPSATPLAGLLPAAWQPPLAGLTAKPLAVSVVAAGPPQALATGITISLGDIGLTASPVLDLNHRTATGALTLRHPSAIALFKLLGEPSGISWPGAGSVSLRADMQLSAAQFGLPDFVLSMGDLTANGSLFATQAGAITGEINADTLALPPIPADFSQFWSAMQATSGKINVSANRVWVAGQEILGPIAGNIALAPSRASFTLTRTALAGGNLSGSLDAAMSPSAAPALTAKFTLTGTDASKLALPIAFPLTLPSGTLGGSAILTATGYSPSAWAATLSGTAQLSAQNGSLSGFNLAGLGAALQSARRAAALRNSCVTGSTNFTALSIAGLFDHGLFNLHVASLESSSGDVSATGAIDVPDQMLALKLALRPAVTNPPALGLTLLGNWANPKQIPAIKPGLRWTAAP
jgi:uncharacterized protein involved in outer membrane biogenesis